MLVLSVSFVIRNTHRAMDEGRSVYLHW